MLAKNSSVQQQPPRRTPLSLSTSMKPTKPNEKNDSNKKEVTNNQKTENLKKDSQAERKLSVDKKQSSTESKRSSSTSSTDSKKPENHKNNKNEDNKKNQNGVNSNGIKDKPNSTNANEVVAKTKPEQSSNGSGSKKESQKAVEKKKDPVVEVATKNDNKDKTAEKIKETKNEENKNKSAEKDKEITVDVSNKQDLDKAKTKENKEDVKVDVEIKVNDEKVDEEKNTNVNSSEKTAVNETNIIDQEVTMIVLDSSDEKSPLKTQSTEETTLLKTPIKDKKEEDTSRQEKPLSEDLLEDVVMMEPLKFIEEEPACFNDFAVSTPAKNCSPKEALHLFEVPSKLSPKSEVKPPKASLTHTPDRKSCPRTFSAISGRRSIRPIGDYTYGGNLQFRESYRKINTELDFTSSSLNVTVGSEVPNNESFSFFTRARKRDRSSPSRQSTVDVQSELSPKSPKRARIDSGVYGFFNAMASPITMLRTRFARASVQSTPKKLIVNPIEQEIVENVSAIAADAADEELTATEEQTFNPTSIVADNNEQCEEPAKCSQSPAVEEVDVDDIKIKETITATDSQAKKKCIIM